MYLFSPFYIKWLYNNPTKAKKSAYVIVGASILINFNLIVGIVTGAFGVPKD